MKILKNNALLLSFLKLVTAALFLVVLAPTASAQIPLNTTNALLRAKAQPDECFLAIGVNLPFTKPPCFISKPKVNQAYVWALTEAGDYLWFGTVANPQCITQSGLFPPESLVPYQTESWVCEFGKGPYSPWLLPGIIGDFRPPQMFRYNKITHVLTEVTPKVPVDANNPLGVDPAVLAVRGIRAAATIGNLVLFAGPTLGSGLSFFAFRADTFEYLGTSVLPGYDNIRQMIVTNGQLYIPVGTNLVGGKVLRWTGSIGPAPCATCFTFQTVGDLDGIGAFVTAHEGKLFVTTWPTGAANVVSGLYMSPPLPPGGLTPANTLQWRKVWSASNYEPDPVTTLSYAGGALASFNGYLYWGTMHVPWFATAIHLGIYGQPATDQAWVEAVIGTFRTTTLFRGRNFDNLSPDVDLLYGWPALGAYRPPLPGQPGKWEIVDNKMPVGKKNPLYGPPGFGNFYNTYTWNMAVWDDRLWVGTMDWSHAAEQGTKFIYQQLNMPYPIEIGSFFAFQNFGADLYFFQSTASPAVPEDSRGLGNYSSFGIRQMLGSGQSFYVGTANTSNLLTGPFPPFGGWELLELQKKPGSGPPNLLTGFSCVPPSATGPGTFLCTATTSAPAAAGAGITIGVLPLAVNVTVTSPTFIPVPQGLSSVTFPVQVSEATAPTQLYLLAGLNGGTMVTSVQLNPGIPRISGQVISQSRPEPGILAVDLRLTNTGTATAQVVTINDLLLRTLTGSGSVTYATGAGRSAPLPLNMGSMPVSGTATVRLYFNVPATVTRFSLTENGTVRSLGGTTYTFSVGQAVIP